MRACSGNVRAEAKAKVVNRQLVALNEERDYGPGTGCFALREELGTWN